MNKRIDKNNLVWAATVIVFVLCIGGLAALSESFFAYVSYLLTVIAVFLLIIVAELGFLIYSSCRSHEKAEMEQSNGAKMEHSTEKKERDSEQPDKGEVRDERSAKE